MNENTRPATLVEHVVMRFSSVEVIIAGSPLKRRVLGFYLLDATLVLDYDADEERETTRHKFKRVRWWSRLDGRNNTMERRDVPQAAINEALDNVRSQIKYA
jgi:hypothetical protein